MNFLKNILSSFIGSVLAILVGGFLLIVLAVAVVMVVVDQPETIDIDADKNKMLQISLTEELVEYKKPTPFDDMDLPAFFGAASQDGLIQLLAAIDEAATDDEIKGIFLNLSGITAGYSQVKEVRDHLLAFREKVRKAHFCI